MSKIFLLTWLKIYYKNAFTSGYDAAKKYKSELNCDSFATTVSQKNLTKADPGTTWLIGLEQNDATLEQDGNIKSGILDEQLKRLQGDSKNCYVVSTNKSHNLSWALSKQAFQKFGTNNRPKVVINLDQHTDCGQASSSTLQSGDQIACSNWGQFHLKYEGAGQDDRYYVVLGCAGQNASGIFWNKPKSQPSSGKTKSDDTTVLSEMKKELEGKDCDVYITIDNDVFNTQITYYPAGVKDQDKVWKLLEDALGTMKGYTVIGGDVTGLPGSQAVNQTATAIAITKAGMKKITDQF